MATKKERKEYTPANLKGYFTMAIEVQRHAFKPEFAVYKLNQSCETLVRCGFCSNHRDCGKCALQYAHEETLKALNDPNEVTRRYKAYIERMNETNKHTNFGAKKYVSKNGYITEVAHYGK